AMIYTHSHLDHFGGVKGIITKEQVDAGEVVVIAPEGFLHHAIAENVFAGAAMTRRAGYMYGAVLDRGPAGQIGAGLGQTTSTGTASLIAPTVDITRTGETLTVDGVEIVFQVTPGTEAPAEMNFYFPQHRALCTAENTSHNLHNILTIRGAVVRDAHAWSKYLTETIDLWGDELDVVFASHHWPTWGRERAVEFLASQRDMYQYLHDQTLRMINQGFTGAEIAEVLAMPPALEAQWHTHGYYGSVSHNIKAIYQRYMGWYDANPANLWAHPPVEAATRYVAAMGGRDGALAVARQAWDDGDYRWCAEVGKHLVFADPDDTEARLLLADVFDQLGFG
ncbi:MAG: MBL fold metallo-hydrolase, partial [Acidimicrobiales bacterium]|nr:MBL fold metallo-hydrolase [Acidimicrobiales bacterium]